MCLPPFPLCVEEVCRVQQPDAHLIRWGGTVCTGLGPGCSVYLLEVVGAAAVVASFGG